jgi:hypothetical protein
MVFICHQILTRRVGNGLKVWLNFAQVAEKGLLVYLMARARGRLNYPFLAPDAAATLQNMSLI